MLTKPTALARQVQRYERQQERKAAKVAREKAEAQAWRVLSLKVYARDKGLCRVCGVQTTPAGKGHPAQWGAVHHIVYRSAGGGDAMSNLILLCFRCHDLEHQHTITIRGTADALEVLR